MPFNTESARKAGTKSKRGPVKSPPVKTKMAQLFEDLIHDLIKNKDKLSIQQKIRLVQLLSNYIVPKTKSVDDDTIAEKKFKELIINWDEEKTYKKKGL